MNGQEVNQTVAQPKPKNVVLSKIWGFVPPPIKNILIKFYTNKKVFIPVTVAFGLILLIIILGLLFGSKDTPVFIPPKKTPTTFMVATPEASSSGDILSVTENKLKELNIRINSLDVGQQKLSPPVIDYNVRF